MKVNLESGCYLSSNSKEDTAKKEYLEKRKHANSKQGMPAMLKPVVSNATEVPPKPIE